MQANTTGAASRNTKRPALSDVSNIPTAKPAKSRGITSATDENAPPPSKQQTQTKLLPPIAYRIPIPKITTAAVTTNISHVRRRISRETGTQQSAENQTSTQQRTVAKVEKQITKVNFNNHPIKKPKVQNWDDLDAEDYNDPLLVSEYVVEIFEYLKELELQTMPNPNYMDEQTELAWKMRAILVDWMIEVHCKFRLLPETLFLAVNIVDRFLSVRIVSLIKFQLVGLTALFIAAKYEELLAPAVKNFIFMAEGGYNEQEVLKAERYILQTLDFKLSYPSPMNFLRRNSKADNYDVSSRTVAKYLLEVALLDHRLLSEPPSKISAAALCLARRMLNNYDWHANLVHYSTYTEEELEGCIKFLIDFLSKPTKYDAAHKKYAAKRFMKASIHVQGWITQFNEKNVEHFE